MMMNQKRKKLSWLQIYVISLARNSLCLQLQYDILNIMS